MGSALLREAESHAVDNVATSIQVDASLAGAEFYRANGLIEVGRGETRLKSGRPIVRVFMRADLVVAQAWGG